MCGCVQTQRECLISDMCMCARVCECAYSVYVVLGYIVHELVFLCEVYMPAFVCTCVCVCGCVCMCMRACVMCVWK